MKRIYLLLLCVLLGCGKLEKNTLPPSSSTESSNKAVIELDNNGCLISHNAEAVNNNPAPQWVDKYKTLMWNCADYLGYNDKHIEKLFWSEDGQCYSSNDEDFLLVSAGDCSTKATVPSNPTVNARLTEFQMSFVNHTTINCQNCYAVNYRYSAKIENTGNVTLWGPALDITSQAGSMGTFISFSSPIPTGGTYQTSETGPFIFKGPGTYDLKADIVFDSMTTTIVVP